MPLARKLSREELMHVGVSHEKSTPGSGRYEFGSGEDPFQHKTEGFYSTYRYLMKSGMSRQDICNYFELSESELRTKITTSKAEQTYKEHERALKLQEEGYSPEAAAEKMGLSIGTYYNRLNYDPNTSRKQRLSDVTDSIRAELKTKKYIDVGSGAELYYDISEETLKAATSQLTKEGYEIVKVPVTQVTNPKQITWMKVLAPAGTSSGDILSELGEVKSLTNFTEHMDNVDLTQVGIHFPESIDGKRVYIRYPDEGGTERDGTIELRRGVEDISLGHSTYAQVRIAVDGKYYMKGVALYRDDIPEGYDVVYNTKHERGEPLDDIYKKLKTNDKGEIDKDNPFGATIKSEAEGGQRWYTDENGERKLSVINKVGDEGDWDEWSKSLSSQFLSKQSAKLVKKQLDLAYESRAAEFEEIMSIENPIVKQSLLETFASDCDSAAVDLKAAALPRQSTKLLIPVTSLKDGEIFAPSYPNGTTVYLVRHPHGGTFEIPKLVVNNNNKEGLNVLGSTPIDAVGINFDAAKKLSGADFDGDTCIVIPETKGVSINTSKTPVGLRDFDNIKEYKIPEGTWKVKDEKGWNKQTQMGIITNLITDMSAKGADISEIERAVRHSMVIIDAEKHNLDYHKSYEDNKIAELKELYQNGGGASTIISKSKSTVYVNERKQIYPEKDWEPETGEVHYTETNRVNYKTGKLATTKSSKMAETKDAFSLISDSNNIVEVEYANYANKLKTLANEARKAYLSAGKFERDPVAAAEYADEVASINEKYYKAKKNAPRERQAQIIAKVALRAKIEENPSIVEDEERRSEYKRLKAQLLSGARIKVGARKDKIRLTEQEWKAIQARAISATKLKSILDNSDMDYVRKLALPKEKNIIGDARKAQIRSMANSGYTMAEISEQLDISVSSVSEAIKEGRQGNG